jgi:hypothetical protein
MITCALYALTCWFHSPLMVVLNRVINARARTSIAAARLPPSLLNPLLVEVDPSPDLLPTQPPPCLQPCPACLPSGLRAIGAQWAVAQQIADLLQQDDVLRR